MRTAVTGSIATDHQMVFPGRFTTGFPPDRPAGTTLSMVVDSLDVRPGGDAANIAFGLGALGHRPALVGAVGTDFGEYRGWLERHGVDTSWLRVSLTRSTARTLSTVDEHGNRIVSLYPGALAEAHAIELSAVPGVDLVMIAPGDARAMLAHAAECRRLGQRVAVDPAPLHGTLTGDQLRTLVDGADHVFTNGRDADVLLDAVGWSRAELLARIGTWVETLGADGVRLESSGAAPVMVPAVPDRVEVDRQGVADAFRAGYLAGLGWRLPSLRAAQVGCLLAALALESRGAQEYRFDPDMFLKRLDEAYGPDAALEVEHKLEPARPSDVDTARRYHR